MDIPRQAVAPRTSGTFSGLASAMAGRVLDPMLLRTVRRLANAKGRLYLAAPQEGGSLAARHADPDDPFRWELVTAEGLRRLNARALDVTPAGRVRPRRSNVTPFLPPVAGPRP